jgi:hypothetical protein
LGNLIFPYFNIFIIKNKIMGYSLEYVTWTNASVEPTFEIIVESLEPGESDNDKACEGLGSSGVYKSESGVLMLKMTADNEDGYILEPYTEVRSRYTDEPFVPNPPAPDRPSPEV